MATTSHALTKAEPAAGSDPHLELLASFWDFARCLGLVGATYQGSPDFHILHTHIMVVVDALPGTTPSFLTRRLNVRAVAISRALAKLAKHRFIAFSSDNEDARRRIICLTERGRNFLRQMDQAGNARFEQWSNRLTPDEIEMLDSWFLAFADGLGAEEGELRPSDHRLRCHMRRVARHLGLLAEETPEHGLRAKQRHVLMFLARHRDSAPPTATALASALRFEPSSLSRMLQSLERLKLVSRIRVASDRRSWGLLLTPKGRGILAQVELADRARVAKALTAFTSAEVARFVSLFRRFYIGSDSPDNAGADHAVRGVLLVSPQQRAEARSFLVETLVRCGRHRDLPARILDHDSFSAALYRGVELVAVCELAPSGKSWCLCNAVAIKAAVSPADLEQLIQLCVRSLRTSHTRVRLPVFNQESFLLISSPAGGNNHGDRG